MIKIKIDMIELIYFSRAGDSKKAYQLIQSRRGEPWQIVDGDELIGEMQKMQGLWKLHSHADIPEGMCKDLAMLIESQHFNQLPEEIKTHWPGKVLEVIVKNDAEYLIICQPKTDLERFVKVFAAYVPHLLKDEWAILFKIYDAEMTEDFEVTVQRGRA